jgi:hypothetical protein
MRHGFPSLVVALALSVCATPDVAHAQGVLGRLKQAVTREYTVRGRLRLHDGQWLTCFTDIKTGYLGPADLARPGNATTDPRTGRTQVTTAAIPTVIRTRRGVVTSNDCDALAEQGLLLPAEPITRSGDTGYSDPYGCTRPEWTKDEVVARGREIMDCQSDSITERAWRRSRARNGGATGSAATGSGATGSSASGGNAATDTAALAAKFRAIQAQGATPATAPAHDSQALAADGAKVCGLTPAFMLELREQAMTFVRYDAAKGTIVMSEMAGGRRRELTLDGAAFAQRVGFNAQAIGQGGDVCGRAFWNAEAYKAASAAMSGR